MKWSLFLGKPLGIKLYIHWTFLILIGWVVFSQYSNGGDLQAALWAVLFVLAVFACVTLHEFGHSIAARRFGVETRNITLLPIGGVASLERIPEKAREELIVAVAGPLVNVVIAMILALGLAISGASFFPESAAQITPANFLSSLMWINVLLVLFNLIPAFPMDGGRMLRAGLAMRMDRVKATRWAVSIGQFFAIIMAFLGLFYNPFLIIIGIFVYLGAQAELGAVESDNILKGYKVGDITMKHYTPLHPYDSLGKAVGILLDTQETHFVVLDEDKIVGTLSKDDIIRGLQALEMEAQIEQVMSGEPEIANPGTPLEIAFEHLREKKQALLPVVEKEKLVGVLDIENITEFMLIRSAITAQKTA